MKSSPGVAPSDHRVPGGKAVLIVEDEAVSRRALTCLLNSYGFHADAVESAEAALDRVREHGAPQVALVDVDLPGMSGIEFLRRLESAAPGVTRVLITASEGERVRSFCRERSDVHYFRKPLDFRRLLGKLNDVGDEPHVRQ